jgi:hypothetical protein
MNRLFAVAVLAVFALAPLVSAQENHPTSKTDVTFSTAVVVGTTTLSPGRYRFECKMINGQHVMVVLQKDKEVARVPCTPVTLDRKVDQNGYRTLVTKDVRVLTEIRIKGESITHKLVSAS